MLYGKGRPPSDIRGVEPAFPDVDQRHAVDREQGAARRAAGAARARDGARRASGACDGYERRQGREADCEFEFGFGCLSQIV